MLRGVDGKCILSACLEILIFHVFTYFHLGISYVKDHRKLLNVERGANVSVSMLCDVTRM